jgi:bacterioferritin
MKGNTQVLETMNHLIADELTAVSQYMVHASMCANWGYDKLHGVIEKRAVDEMKHAETLIDRVLFLEGQPIVNRLNPMKIGAQIPDQFKNDQSAEIDAIKAYNAAIRQAGDLDDNGTKDLLTSILKDEEQHLDWLEIQLDQIDQVGLQNYLALQVA